MQNVIDFVRQKQKAFLVSVGALAILLRFIPISLGDFYEDSAINSFRAFGWFDYLGRSGQSVPFEWFGYIPAWAKLSFHDAPPLAFFVQHLFFSMFGDGVAVARLPFVLSGLAAAFITYFFLKKISDQGVAAVGLIVYTIISYNVWAGQAAYLEGIEELFIAGSVLFGGYWLFKEQKTRHLYIWAVLIALALLTKYTALFLIPPIIIYIFLSRNEFKSYWKHVIFSIIAIVALLSPVIIYNINMYRTRGHFDAALSSIAGMHPEDFWIISERSVSSNPIQNLPTIFTTLAHSLSYPLMALFVICLGVLVFNTKKRGFKSFESWILVNFLFLVILFCFSGAGTRFESILIPFIVIVTALGVRDILDLIKAEKKRKIFFIPVALIFAGELFYSINTNVLKNPIGPAGWLYSETKVRNLGFNQLDSFIRGNALTNLPFKNDIEKKEDIIFSNEDISGRSAVIFDDRINWFSQMWYMQKYFLYYRWPYISTSYFSANNPQRIDLGQLREVSGEPLYFIYPINDLVLDEVRSKDERINRDGPALSAEMEKQAVPYTTITNASGIPVFKVYKLEKPL